MDNISLKAQMRAKTGAGYGRQLRTEGKIPAVIYGKGSDNLLVQMNVKELKGALHSGKGRNALFEINFEGSKAAGKTTVMLRDLQVDPLKGNLLHADFYQVAMGEKIHAQAPVHLVGEASGVKAGGLLQQQIREIAIECLPGDIPEAINLDVSGLEVGHSLTVKDVTVSPNIKILAEEQGVIVSCLSPRVMDEATEIAPARVQETEVKEAAAEHIAEES